MKTFTLCSAAVTASLIAGQADAAATFLGAYFDVRPYFESVRPTPLPELSKRVDDVLFAERSNCCNLSISRSYSTALFDGPTLLSLIDGDAFGLVNFGGAENGTLVARAFGTILNRSADVSSRLGLSYSLGYRFSVDMPMTVNVDYFDGGLAKVSRSDGGPSETFIDMAVPGTGSFSFDVDPGFTYAMSFEQGEMEAFRIDGVGRGFGLGGSVYGIKIVPQPIPEPNTWAMAIAGFGIAGSTLRRRRLARS